MDLLCAAYRTPVSFHSIGWFLLGFFTDGTVPTQGLSLVHSVERTSWMEFCLADHRLRLDWPVLFLLFYSSIARESRGIREAFSGRVCLGIIKGLGCTWWHCPADHMYEGVLLGWGAEALDSPVSNETCLEKASTQA